MPSIRPLPNPNLAASGAVASGLPEAKRPHRRTACPHCGEMPSKPKRPRAATTDEDYRASMLRMVNSYANRIVAAGVTALADAVAVRHALDLVIDAGVEVCRSGAWSASWADVAAATGLSLSAAAERWGPLQISPQGRWATGQPPMTYHSRTPEPQARRPNSSTRPPNASRLSPRCLRRPPLGHVAPGDLADSLPPLISVLDDAARFVEQAGGGQ